MQAWQPHGARPRWSVHACGRRTRLTAMRTPSLPSPLLLLGCPGALWRRCGEPQVGGPCALDHRHCCARHAGLWAYGCSLPSSAHGREFDNRAAAEEECPASSPNLQPLCCCAEARLRAAAASGHLLGPLPPQLLQSLGLGGPGSTPATPLHAGYSPMAPTQSQAFSLGFSQGTSYASSPVIGAAGGPAGGAGGAGGASGPDLYNLELQAIRSMLRLCLGVNPGARWGASGGACM